MCWHVVLSQPCLSHPLALSATGAVGCEVPCGARDVVEDAPISLSGVSQLAFQGKQPPREDGQAEITSREVPGDSLRGGDGLSFPFWLSLGVPIALCDDGK